MKIFVKYGLGLIKGLASSLFGKRKMAVYCLLRHSRTRIQSNCNDTVEIYFEYSVKASYVKM